MTAHDLAREILTELPPGPWTIIQYSDDDPTPELVWGDHNAYIADQGAYEAHHDDCGCERCTRYVRSVVLATIEPPGPDATYGQIELTFAVCNFLVAARNALAPAEETL